MRTLLTLIIALVINILVINANPIEEESENNFYSNLNSIEPIQQDQQLIDYSNEQNNNEDDLDPFLTINKKSAPRRIFIGKRAFASLYEPAEESGEYEDMVKKNPRRHLFLGKRSFKNANGKRHIQRIFIGKRGDIKRIFIG